MKITVARKELSDAMKIVTKAIATKSQTPILSGIYFSAAGSCLELQGTDHSIGIVAKIPANVEESGETVILGAKIFEIVQRLSGEVVTIETEKNQAKIKSGASEFSLLIFNAEDFPKIEREENLKSFSLTNWKFKKLIRQTAYAAGDSTDRMIFTGILFHLNGESLTLAATNTHRLAVAIEKLSESTEEEKFVVPAKILSEISRMLDDAGKIEIVFAPKTANFIFDNVFVTARLIDGNYPPYEKVFPKESTTLVTVDREEFLRAIERVSLIGKETEYRTVDLLFGENEIKISAHSAEIGNAEEKILAEVEGGEVDISFNYEYLTDVLKAIDAEKVRIGLSESLKPADFQSENFRYVVTPVRRT